MTNAEALSRHYASSDVSARVRAALGAIGKPLDQLTHEDLAGLDQLHGGGIDATRALASAAGAGAGMRVLDIGSGLGGPARVLAAEFGCSVVGVDLTEEFCAAAAMLTEMLGLGDCIEFRYADALDLPFDGASFDIAWTQNALMNIEDKASVLDEARRVLRPGGTLAVQSIMAGVGEPDFPTMWADGPSMNHLIRPEAFRDLVLGKGFEVVDWRDVALAPAPPGGAPQPTPLDPMLRSGDGALRRQNAQRNMADGRITTLQAVLRRP